MSAKIPSVRVLASIFSPTETRSWTHEEEQTRQDRDRPDALCDDRLLVERHLTSSSVSQDKSDELVDCVWALLLGREEEVDLEGVGSTGRVPCLPEEHMQEEGGGSVVPVSERLAVSSRKVTRERREPSVTARQCDDRGADGRTGCRARG